MSRGNSDNNASRIPRRSPCRKRNYLENWGGTPLLARWTTDFDCGYENGWWYIVKDSPFDPSSLKAKRRYEITKGTRYFDVKRIRPEAYAEELYSVQVAAFSGYPTKSRPHVEHDAFVKSVSNWGAAIIYGAFFRESGELAGYAMLHQISDRWMEFNVLKTVPAFEKYAVNAAIVSAILAAFESYLASGGIICDGSRSINHETHFQDYLEKYFGFRKAYCKLHIAYHPKIKWVIRAIYPFRLLLQKLDGIGFIHQINAVLKMEEITRSCKCPI